MIQQYEFFLYIFVGIIKKKKECTKHNSVDVFCHREPQQDMHQRNTLLK